MDLHLRAPLLSFTDIFTIYNDTVGSQRQITHLFSRRVGIHSYGSAGASFIFFLSEGKAQPSVFLLWLIYGRLNFILLLIMAIFLLLSSGFLFMKTLLYGSKNLFCFSKKMNTHTHKNKNKTLHSILCLMCFATGECFMHCKWQKTTRA